MCFITVACMVLYRLENHKLACHWTEIIKIVTVE
jgi:hypothetical protein